jgi:PAS domain S-box-containing protein
LSSSDPAAINMEIQKNRTTRGRPDKKSVNSVRKGNWTVAESEEALRLLFDTANDYSAITVTPKGDIASWNTGAERLHGYQTDEIIGKHFSCLYSPDDLERGLPDHALELATVQGRHQAQTWQVRKDGSRFYGNVIIGPLKSKGGKLSGFSKVTRDLTEAQFAEMAHALVESFPSAILLIDHDGRIIQMNGDGYPNSRALPRPPSPARGRLQRRSSHSPHGSWPRALGAAEGRNRISRGHYVEPNQLRQG